MAIRAVVFDLFNTLVDLSMHNLPRVEIRGEWIPTTTGVLHGAVAARFYVEALCQTATLLTRQSPGTVQHLPAAKLTT